MSSVKSTPAGATFFVAPPNRSLPTEWREDVGAVLGPYRLVERIGEGGMGVVFRAEQQVGAVRREVAVKIVKAGMHTDRVMSMFDRERQALALMDHPGIARVFDAGATASGRPYFAMELVRGAPIHRYCDERRLSIADRLRLFVDVCKAVQHAHHKGVIHRDLKPSNILVADCDGAAAPKIIDFGIARAVENSQAGWEAITGAGEVVGTLEYMSPEQTRLGRIDIDTRSDVYSLGVVLFELLSGAPPISSDSLRDQSLHQAVRRICEEDAPLCSRRAVQDDSSGARTAELRSTTARRLQSSLRGDLDAVVAKALEKDRNRRYETVDALAQDLQRYLNLEPVHARPTTVRYRLGKLIRRHRTAAAAVAAFALLLVGTAAVSTGLAMWALAEKERASQALNHARRERRMSQEFQNLLLDAFRSPSPDRDGGDAKVVDVLNRVAEDLETKFDHDPKARVRLQVELARTFIQVAPHGRVLEMLESARRSLIDDPEALPLDLDASDLLAEAYHQNHRFDEGLKLAKETYERRREARGPADPKTISTQLGYANKLLDLGNSALALPLLQDAKAVSLTLPADDPMRHKASLGLAIALEAVGKTAESRTLYKEALDGFENRVPFDHPERLRAVVAYVLTAERLGDFAEIERYAKRFLAPVEKKFGKQHQHASLLRHRLATAEVELGEIEQGVARMKAWFDERYPAAGADKDDVLVEITRMAEVYCRARRPEAALALVEDAAARLTKSKGPQARNLFYLNDWRGGLLLHLERAREAEPVLRAVLAESERRGENSYNGKSRVVRSQGELGDCLVSLGKLDEGEKLLRAAAEGAKSEKFNAATLASWKASLGMCCLKRSARDEGVRLLEEARNVLTKPNLAGRWLTPKSRLAQIDETLIAVYRAAGRHAEADRLQTESAARKN